MGSTEGTGEGVGKTRAGLFGHLCGLGQRMEEGVPKSLSSLSWHTTDDEACLLFSFHTSKLLSSVSSRADIMYRARHVEGDNGRWIVCEFDSKMAWKRWGSNARLCGGCSPLLFFSFLSVSLLSVSFLFVSFLFLPFLFLPFLFIRVLFLFSETLLSSSFANGRAGMSWAWVGVL